MNVQDVVRWKVDAIAASCVTWLKASRGRNACRECQYISGGTNMFILMPPEGFSYTKERRNNLRA
jgi:hypothetical protein